MVEVRWVVLVIAGGCGFHPTAGTDVAPDGRLHDGPTEDVAIDASDGSLPAACPPDYLVTISATTTRYKIVTTSGTFAAQLAACKADSPALAHLASLETPGEITGLQAVLAATTPPAPSSQYYVGAVQQPGQAQVDTGWYVFSGAPLPTGQWANGQPNDDNPGENDEENVGALNAVDLMHDATGDVVYGAVCECDGHVIDPTVASYLP
jgi:hypothetical protein